MKEKYIIILSVALNIVALVVFLLVSFTPFFDMILFTKSAKTICDEVEKLEVETQDEENVLNTFCKDWYEVYYKY
jgi:hypothetical protein